MKFRLSSLLLVRLFLTLRSTLSTERTVIIDVSENQEWASGRDNYAHLLLAGVSGIVNVLGRSGLLFDRSITELRLTLRGDSGLWGAGNAQSLLRQWTGRLNEVFTPWNVTLNDADADADDDDDDDKEAVRSTSSRAALQCSVPHLSFCDPSFWPQFGPALRTFLRSQFPTPHHHHHIVTTPLERRRKDHHCFRLRAAFSLSCEEGRPRRFLLGAERARTSWACARRV